MILIDIKKEMLLYPSFGNPKAAQAPCKNPPGRTK